LEGARPISLSLKTIGQQDLLAGDYEIEMLFAYPGDAVEGSAFKLTLSGSNGPHSIKDYIDAGQRAAIEGRMLNRRYRIPINDGCVTIHLEPVRGAIHLCGVIINQFTLRGTLGSPSARSFRGVSA
jgi:hypothetical protein